MADFTYCHDCDNVHPSSRKQPPWSWLCVKHPRKEGFGYVTPFTWDNMEPYLRCKDVNGGACPLFEPKKEGEQ